MSVNVDKAELRGLYDLGFSLHWLHPRSKRPIEMGWTKGERKSWLEFWNGFRPNLNVGVRLGRASRIDVGYLAVIDCDVKSSDQRHQVEMKVALARLKLPPAAVVLSGRGNGSRHYYVVTGTPAEPRRVAQSSEIVRVQMPSSGTPSLRERKELSEKEIGSGWRLRVAWEISIMGEGQQVVLPPSIHPDSGKPYQWERPWVKGSQVFSGLDGFDSKKSTPNSPKIDFQSTPVDLSAHGLSDQTIGQIVSGAGVSDRSAALLGVCNRMLKVGMTDQEILSVLTDPEYFLGGVGYDHAKTSSRAVAAEWVRKFTLEKSKKETLAAEHFKDAVVVEADSLSDEEASVQASELAPVDPDWRSRLQKIGKNGEGGLKNNFKNILLILTHAVGADLFRYDEFSNSEIYGLTPPWDQGRIGAEVTDRDTNRIKAWLIENYGLDAGKEVINEVVTKISDDNHFHPVRDYLDALPKWDGVFRIDSFFKNYLNATAPEPYLSAISRKMLTAMVARIYEPGCKFDHVVILEGTQGIGKSTALRRLVGDAWFTDATLNVTDKDAILNMRSAWLIELGELSSLRSGEIEHVKEFISRTTDRVRVPYGKRSENFPRQCIFAGTTNRHEYLKDQTGNRRFWPVQVGACDFQAVGRDRDQLFAEAKITYREGEPLYLEEVEMQKGAFSEQEERTTEDVWFDDLHDWLLTKDETPFKFKEIFEPGGPLGNRREPNDQRRISEILTKLGCERFRIRKEGGKQRFWVKKSE